MLGQISNFRTASYHASQNRPNRMGFSAKIPENLSKMNDKQWKNLLKNAATSEKELIFQQLAMEIDKRLGISYKEVTR